ncbi:MAG: hypothetical protein ACLQPV_08200 [Vulcanimicrobiaceae bacterium]
MGTVTSSTRLRFATCTAAIALAFGSVLAAPAGATGLVRVQQNNGSIQEYPNVRIDYSKDAKTLTITTADGKGTLLIDQAACSYLGQVYRCLLTHMSLTQNGQTKPLDFSNGTIYANTTDGNLNLPLSSQIIPPKGIVMALTTDAGTYISMTGTIDSGVK